MTADTIVLRDGTRREGTLRSCDEERCSLDGKGIDVSLISRIELRSVIFPSSVRANSILQTDGTIVEGPFTGLNRGYVYAGDQEIDRDLVAVIFIEAPPAPEPPPEPPPVVQPSQPPPATAPPPPSQSPPSQSPPSQPPPPPSPPPVTPPSSSSGSRPSPGGRMWTGRVRGLAWGNVDSCRSRLNIDVVVRLREERVTPLVQMDGTVIGTATTLFDSDSTVRNRYRSVCREGGAGGSGTTVVTRAEGNEAGSIYRNTSRGPRRTANGIDLQPGDQWYLLSIAPDENEEYDVTYTTPLHTSTSPSGFIYPVIGGQPVVPLTAMGDPEPRFLLGGRMSGAYVTAATGVFEKLALSWSICPEGVPCPQTPPLPDEAQQQRCPQEALAELCGDQLMSYLEELEPMQEEYARLMKLAESFYPDYLSALRRCAAWKLVQTILETILGAQTTKLGRAGEDAANALKWFEALIEGDPAGPMGDALTGDAEEAFMPLELANKIKGYLEEGNQIGDLLSKSGDLNALRGAAVDACLGAVNPEIHMRAEKFIQYTREAAEYYRNVFAPKMNDIDAKMRECEDRDTAAATACQ